MKLKNIVRDWPEKKYSSTNDPDKCFNDPWRDGYNSCLSELADKDVKVRLNNEKIIDILLGIPRMDRITGNIADALCAKAEELMEVETV